MTLIESYMKVMLFVVSSPVQAKAVSVCEEEFLPSFFSSGGVVNTVGDQAVLQLSQLILDDPPPSLDTMDGPAPSGTGGGHASSSMILIYRLQQKVEAHCKYLHFLLEVELLHKLTSVQGHTGVMATVLVLREHAELLQCALTLRKLHDQYVPMSVCGAVCLHGLRQCVSLDVECLHSALSGTLPPCGFVCMYACMYVCMYCVCIH